MKKIDIIYNPYTEKAGLTIDGNWHYGGDGRLNEFFVGKSIEQWLPRRIVSYQRWDGILPELMEYLNDDELQIRFCGTESDYRRVEKELKKQERTAEEMDLTPNCTVCLSANSGSRKRSVSLFCSLSTTGCRLFRCKKRCWICNI